MSKETLDTSSIQPVNEFWRVVQGEVDLHVWRSRTYPDTILGMAATPVGAPLSAEDRQAMRGKFPSWEDCRPYYAGIMPVDEAAERAAAHDAALARADMEG